MIVPRLDKEIGIEVYATRSQGFGGKLRQSPEDFKVEEILTNGSIAQIEPDNIPNITGHNRYIIFVLVKRKLDVFQAIQMIANQLGISQERIQIAGIKDANAITAQHVSISRMLPEQAAQIRTRNLWLYPLSLSSNKISSDVLLGNRFRINVRDITYSAPATMKRANAVLHELSELNGCPNFFGHQRFGTTRAITHIVGKHILRGEWEQAALAFLAKASKYENPKSREARQRLHRNQNYQEALDYFPQKLVYERQMLKHLAVQRRDFRGAFYRLPIKLCQLLIQAYQSYLFNRFLSQRIIHELPLVKARAGEHSLTIDGEERLALPLIGYRQGTSSGQQGEIEKSVLDEEDITPERFKIQDMPKISSSGGLRAAVTPIIDMQIGKPSRDEANVGKRALNLSFTLRKGSYATVIMREFMKPRSPVTAGF